jgi:putative ABC transport system permease protein
MMLLKRLLRKPLRTTLAVLEVLLGTLAVTLALSAYLGSPQLRAGLSDTFELVSGTRNDKGEAEEIRPVFTEDKLLEIKQLAPDIETLGMYGRTMYFFPVYVQAGNDIFEFQDEAIVSPQYFDVMDMVPARGSFFTEAERGKNVVVISEGSSKILFGSANPVGKELKIMAGYNGLGSELPSVIFRVVGTFEDGQAVKSSWGYTMLSKPALLYPAWLEGIGPVANTQEFLIAKAKDGRGEAARQQLLNAVRQVYRNEIDSELTFTNKDFYFAEPAQSFMTVSNYIDPTVILFGIFGIVSLITGAIGIFSIMLVDTLERTHETGIRRAIGASKTRIMWEVSSEATVVSLVGGVLGIALAALLIPVLNNTVGTTLFQQSELRWQPLAALVALGSAVLLSAVLSLLPAWQAVRMKPIEALKGI